MGEATLRVLGVYRPAISKETRQEQWEVTEDDAKTEDHFARLVLIEGVVGGLDRPMDFGEFGQMQAEFPDDPRRMMVGYDEGLLSADGETLLARDMDCVQGTGPLRFAVSLHLYDPERPLRWQGGEEAFSPVEDAVVWLMALVQFRPYQTFQKCEARVCVGAIA